MFRYSSFRRNPWAPALAAAMGELKGGKLARRIAEQKMINRYGGVAALENQINSIAPKYWVKYGITR